MNDWLQASLTSNGFMPHGQCYLWNPSLLGLHVISDFAIFLAYASIPISLASFVRKRKDLPFNWIFVMFGLFIVACGLTHFFAVVTIWYPTYWLTGALKLIAALVSVVTAVALFPLMPRALAIPSPTMLKKANHDLEQQVAERLKAEEELKKANRDLEEQVAERLKAEEELKKANYDLEEQVAERLKAEEELKEKNQKLEESLEALHNAQAQLVQQEKMASLGQLIAGVAHEINNPMGAIQSSATIIGTHLKLVLEKLPELFRALTEEEQEDFFSLLSESFDSQLNLTVKEKRQKKKEVMAELEKLGFEKARNTADVLVSLGVTEKLDQHLPLLRHPEQASLLDMAYHIADLHKNNQNVLQASDRAGKIVYALKSFSRFDHSGELVDTDLKENIEVVLSLYHNQIKHGCEVVKNYENIPLVPCYPDALGQVWTNLIHNALQAMEHKGTLTIDVAQVEKNVVISIGDTGGGIPEDIKNKIFDPFFTTKSAGEGSGLGLDIVRKIVENHDGKIEIDSKVGVGTTFQIHLPMAS